MRIYADIVAVEMQREEQRNNCVAAVLFPFTWEKEGEEVS